MDSPTPSVEEGVVEGGGMVVVEGGEMVVEKEEREGGEEEEAEAGRGSMMGKVSEWG